MTEETPDPTTVENAVRRAMRRAYDSPDPRKRYDASTPAERLHAAVAARLAQIRAEAVRELSKTTTDKTALGHELGLKRQRVQQLIAQAERDNAPIPQSET